MTLHTLRQRVVLWLSRPLGQLGALLWLMAMISAGMPTAPLHHHSGGDAAHQRFVQTQGSAACDSGALQAAADPTGDRAFHSHGSGTNVSTLPTLLELVLVSAPPLAPAIRWTAVSPRSLPQVPPLRPPIA